ncbi:MAG: hypothetical protein ACE3JQ_09040 [Paenisporosarcina sp.]
MIFVSGFGISLLILCTAIYLLPQFTNKKTLLILILWTTSCFILSSFMGMLYSAFIGVGIFFLLIGSLAILIGKNQSWFEILYKENHISKRRQYKQILVANGTQLENISSSDDHLLFKKFIDNNEIFQTSVEFKVLAEIEEHPQHDESILEVAATSPIVYDVQGTQSNQKQNHEMHDEIIVYSMDDSKKEQMNDNKQTKKKVDDELSDQWMQNRMSALFNETAQEQPVTPDEHEDLEGKINLSYDDLSENYLSHMRSGKDGTKK